MSKPFLMHQKNTSDDDRTFPLEEKSAVVFSGVFSWQCLCGVAARLIAVHGHGSF